MASLWKGSGFDGGSYIASIAAVLAVAVAVFPDDVTEVGTVAEPSTTGDGAVIAGLLGRRRNPALVEVLMKLCKGYGCRTSRARRNDTTKRRRARKVHYRLTHVKRFLAFGLPVFFLSTTLGSLRNKSAEGIVVSFGLPEGNGNG